MSEGLIAAQLEEKMIAYINWVSVAEQLPPNDEWVLYASSDFYTWIGYYNYGRDEKGCVIGWRDTSENSVEVTHWAHLPEGPQRNATPLEVR